MEIQPDRGVHRFAVFTAGCTFFLLAAGALVTSNDAGLAVPDWPLSYGSLLPPMVGGIRYEHGHRMLAAFVGFLTVILAVWLWRVEPRRWVRAFGWVALGLVVAQGLLGGLTVILLLPPSVSSAHATLAQLFFASVLSLGLFTGNWWQKDLPQFDDPGSPRLRVLAVATAVVILLQIVLGAIFRHHGFGIVPHLIGAGVVTLMVVCTGRTIRQRFPRAPALRRGVKWLHSSFGLQILLGGVAWWAVRAAADAPQPVPLTVWITVAHVVVGALLFGSSVLLALCSFRLVRPARTLAVESHAAGASL
jgi:cytochrome c oxidase assembly protein subunit 15